jgi:hypothetical protein
MLQDTSAAALLCLLKLTFAAKTHGKTCCKKP